MFRTRLLFFVSLAIIGLLVAESASYLALWLVTGERPSPVRWRAARAAAAQSETGPLPPVALPRTGRPFAGRAQVVHPFLGYVERPGAPGHAADQEVSELGFVVRRAAPGARSGDEVFRVGVFGGSVAQMLALLGGDALARELRSLPAVGEQEVVVQGFALGGFKQPQQLMTLNYLLALGEPLDLVIVLDGFNDLVLPATENLRIGLHPFYPRLWPHRIRPPDADRVRRVGEVAYLRQRRVEIARAFEGRLSGRSPTAQLVWRSRDRRLAGRIARLEREIALSPQPRWSYALHGPPFPALPEEALYRQLAVFWARCSLLMHGLCAAKGIPYFHFLQPNQYVLGSKRLTLEERRVAVRKDSPYAPPAGRGYRFLVAEGETLRRSGVRFHDLTGIFADVEESIYIDDCCHVGARGNELLAAAIGERIKGVSPAAPRARSRTAPRARRRAAARRAAPAAGRAA